MLGKLKKHHRFRFIQINQKAGFDIERGEVNSETVHRTDLAKKQIAVESKEKKLKKENASLRKEIQQLKTCNEALNALLISEQSMTQRLTLKKLEA